MSIKKDCQSLLLVKKHIFVRQLNSKKMTKMTKDITKKNQISYSIYYGRRCNKQIAKLHCSLHFCLLRLIFLRKIMFFNFNCKYYSMKWYPPLQGRIVDLFKNTCHDFVILIVYALYFGRKPCTHIHFFEYISRVQSN